ncbi:MAG: NlpC/P60 family protein [Actinomycetota bacterium]|nr:NlpC/P60 family protein [Actinomycetota bacterium]
MTTRAPIARHRAEAPKTSSIAVIAKAVSSNAGGVGRQAAVIAAASGLVLTSGIAANAAPPTAERVSDASSTMNIQDAGAKAITAASSIQIPFAKSEVTSSPAPAKAVVAAKSNTIVATNGAAGATTNVALASTTDVAAKPAIASGVGAAIVSAAYAQLGVHQDCTALVSNALAAAGINYHGWPAGYLSLGRTVSEAEAQPGDLVYYDNAGAGVPHIGVYVGNGKAVHGGFNGSTVLASVYLGSGPVFIAIGH